MQAVVDGGLLCVTCTDMTVLSGNYPEVCFAKYGSMPVRAKYLHEMSLRILLNSIESAANKYKRHMVPWLSISVDFYVRVFVRIYESPAEVKRSCLKRGMVYQSVNSGSFFVQPLGVCSLGKKLKLKQKLEKQSGNLSTNDSNTEPITVNVNVAEKETKESSVVSNDGNNFQSNHLTVSSVCPQTNGRMKTGGPFWIGNLHDQSVADELLNRLETTNNPPSTSTRIIGILTSISEELKDVPFYYDLQDLSSTLQMKTPQIIEMKSALINAGYNMSNFHREPLAIKTNAPDSVVWDIMRAYAKLYPPEGSIHKKFPEVAKTILAKENTIQVDFTLPEVIIYSFYYFIINEWIIDVCTFLGIKSCQEKNCKIST